LHLKAFFAEKDIRFRVSDEYKTFSFQGSGMLRISNLQVRDGSPVIGRTIQQIELGYAVKIHDITRRESSVFSNYKVMGMDIDKQKMEVIADDHLTYDVDLKDYRHLIEACS